MCVIECSTSKSMYVYILIANSLLITSQDFHFFKNRILWKIILALQIYKIWIKTLP